MSGLNIDLLDNVHQSNGKTIARCPACAEEGGDNKGEHLMITADGKFGCVMYPGTEGAAHRKRIRELADNKSDIPGRQGERKTKLHATMEDCAKASLWGLEKTSKAKWKQTRCDIYHDKNGNPVAAVLRFDQVNGETDKNGKSVKQFRPIHREPGGWRTGDPPGKWPLFRLHEIRPGPVFICEGEKAACAGIEAGLNCTTSAHGSNAAEKTDWTPLSGRDAYILRDNDAGGLKYGRKVTELVEVLNPPGKARILKLPGLPPAGDLVDFIALNPGKDIVATINKLVEGAEVDQPPETESADPEPEPPMEPGRSEVELLTEVEFGRPYFFSEKGVLNALSEPYWAGLYAAEHIVLHEPDEGEFYRYDEETGLYREHTSARIKTEIASRLLEAADNWKESGLVKLRKDSILNGIVAHLRGQIEHREAFSKKDRRFIHLANGVVVFDGDKAALTSFSPEYRSRNQSPIAFDPKATCDRFLDELIRPAVHEEDVLLLQKFAGLFLLGDNIIQRVLVLDGTPGGGKSQFCQVMQNLIGKVNCTQLRTELLAERFEIYRFLKKSLLYGADVPADFLNTKGASRLKSLVGGDLLDAECKGHKGSFPVEGRFNVLVTSNARLRVHLEGDIGAWRRRLTIVRYENPPPKKKIPDFGQLLIDTEGSGILNWALVGLSELFKDVADTGDIRLTGRQNKVVESLLAESDSLRIFLKDQMESAPNSDVTIKDIKEAYAVYCPSRGWNALPITIIERQLEGLMLELFHVCKSNSCGDNKKERGFRGVRFMHDGGLL